MCRWVIGCVLALTPACSIVENLRALQQSHGDGGVLLPELAGPDAAALLQHDGATPEPAQPVHVRLTSLEEMRDFFDLPWPHALRRRPGGGLDPSLFPAQQSAFLRTLLAQLADRVDGFGTNAAMLVAFDGPLDWESTPDDAVYAAVLDGAAAGERVALRCAYRDQGGSYAPDHLLACIPGDGVPLRPDTQYGLFITDGVLAADGTPVAASALWRALGDEPTPDDPLAAAYAPLFAHARAAGVFDALVGGTVFRTGDPARGLRVLAEHARRLPSPRVRALAPLAASAGYALLSGSYQSPFYQQGESPFASEGGEILFGADGQPELERFENLRFVLSVPLGSMPAGGWPVLLYHHGAGGDATSLHNDGVAALAAAAGVAVIGIDAPLHGARAPAGRVGTSSLFVNLDNPVAWMDNLRQAAVELVVLEQLVAGLSLGPSESSLGAALRFDPSRIFFMGHSQGAAIGAMFLAVAERVRGAVLSAAGGSITRTLLYRERPSALGPALAERLGLATEEPLDASEPSLSLLQSLLEPADTSNYAPFAYRWSGGRPFHLWMIQGLMDDVVPPLISDALAAAYGVQPVAPIARSVPELRVQGLPDASPPVLANLEAHDGQRYTAVYTQHPQAGHAGLMRDEALGRRLRAWLASMLAGTARLVD